MIFKSTVELYFDVKDEHEACDATAEMLRPLLQEFAGTNSCFIDWCHARQYGNSPEEATPDEIHELEYKPQTKEIV